MKRALALTALFLATACSAPERKGVAIDPTAAFGVFAEGEQPHFTLKARGSAVVWRVGAPDGATVAEGRLRLEEGAGEIAPQGLRPGAYTLEARGQSGRADARAFAVMPKVADEPAAFGVMTHFAQDWDLDIVPLMAKAGIYRARDEIYWEDVEDERGRYETPNYAQDYLAAFAEYAIDPLFVLSFANPLYDDGRTPHSDEGVAAFAAYAAALLAAHPGRFDAVEVWNEYNGSFCKGPCDENRPAFYAKMLKATHDAVKAVDPRVTVVGGATVAIPMPYLREVFEEGALGDMDALGVHPYGADFDTIGETMDDLRALMGEFGDAATPVWFTEFGRSSADEARYTVAADMVRTLTAMRAAGVARVYWYLLRDYAAFSTMGLLHGPDDPLGRYAPTPAYVAYANLNARIGAAAPVCRAQLDPRTYVHRFAGSDGPVWVAWTGGGAADLALTPDGPAQLSDIWGGTTAELAAGETAVIALSETPIFITGALSSLSEARPDRLVADSLAGYSQTQGGDGWSYARFDDADGALDPARIETDQWASSWGGEYDRYMALGPTGQHAPAGKTRFALRRWTSDRSGAVAIAGDVEARGDGDGVEAQLRVNGQTLWRAHVGGGDPEHTTFEVAATLAEGDLVDMLIGPGPKGDNAYDTASVHVRILAPEPVANTDGACVHQRG